MLRPLLGVLLCFLAAVTGARADDDFAAYLWETHTPGDLAPGARPLIVELRRQIDAVLDAGHLAPLRFSGADQKAEGFYLYTEPGRILNTFGAAWPYLAAAQQARARDYLRRELAEPAFTPWATNDTLPPDRGARREFFAMERPWQWDWARQQAASRPRVAPLYGLWLCAYRSGDFGAVRGHWPEIREFLARRKAQADLLGTLGAHVALARLAAAVGDTNTQAAAENDGRAAFRQSLDLGRQVARMRQAYARQFDSMHGRGLSAANWFFLDLTPEAGRLLHDQIREAVLARHRKLLETFPHWWVYRPWYANGWTGHESEGLPPEILGMIFPIERWVRRAPPETLAGYQPQNAAHGIGDCHALEALCLAIGAFGDDRWLDVRQHPIAPIVTLGGRPLADLDLAP